MSRITYILVYSNLSTLLQNNLVEAIIDFLKNWSFILTFNENVFTLSPSKLTRVAKNSLLKMRFQLF